MPKFNPLDSNKIARSYIDGESIALLAQKYRCRKQKISHLLYEEGVDPSQWRGFKISNARRGVPTKYDFLKSSRLNKLTHIQWSYLSGLFDGEGCLNSDKRWHNFRVTISQNGYCIHQYLQELLGGGSICKAQDKLDHYQFRLSSQPQVYEFLINILPYCIIKKEQVVDAIDIVESKYGPIIKERICAQV